MDQSTKDIIIGRLMESEDIQAVYDVFIEKTISFEDWVKRSVDMLLEPGEALG